MTATATAVAADFTVVESTVTVFDFEVDTAKKKLAKVNKRLAKLGAPAATIEFGDPIEKTETDPVTGFTKKWTEYEATVTGVEAKWSGWTAVASIDWTVNPDEGWVSKFPAGYEVTVPDNFRVDGPVCDHCKLDRRRNLTVVFANEDGDMVRVGTGCTLEYLGVDPTTALWLAGPSLSEDDFDGDRMPAMFDTAESFLAVAAAITDKFGFCPTTGDGWPTRDAASTYLAGRWTKAESEAFADVNPDIEVGKMLAEWTVENMTSGSDFDYNARLAVTGGIAHPRTMGIMAYLPTAYNRAMAEAAEVEAEAVAEANILGDLPEPFHLGAVKERVKDLPVMITKAFSIETAYGVSRRVDARVVAGEFAGAIVGSFGSGKDLFATEEGDFALWTGTISEHSDDKYGVVNNCKRVKLTLTDEDFGPLPVYIDGCWECNVPVYDTDEREYAAALGLRPEGAPGVVCAECTAKVKAES